MTHCTKVNNKKNCCGLGMFVVGVVVKTQDYSPGRSELARVPAST